LKVYLDDFNEKYMRS